MTLQEEVANHHWYQQIDLGNGVVTPGIRKPLWDEYGLWSDLTGMTVLDIGSNDGFYAFEAERRGAAKVTAIDIWNQQCDGGIKSGSDDGFRLAKRVFNSCVFQRVQSVYELNPRLDGMFDVVLLPQILYHLQHPLLALQRIYPVTAKWFFIESAIDLEEVEYPAMRYYPGAELCEDPTNWWGPNKKCIVEMLKTAGFKDIHETWTNGNRAAFIASC